MPLLLWDLPNEVISSHYVCFSTLFLLCVYHVDVLLINQGIWLIQICQVYLITSKWGKVWRMLELCWMKKFSCQPKKQTKNKQTFFEVLFCQFSLFTPIPENNHFPGIFSINVNEMGPCINICYKIPAKRKCIDDWNFK